MKLQRIVEKEKEVNRIQKTVTVFCRKIHNVESAGRLALDEQITRGSLVDTCLSHLARRHEILLIRS